MQHGARTIRELWDSAFTHSRDHVKQHHLNHAYLEGYQWLQWNPVDRQVDQLPPESRRIQAKFNHMRSNDRSIIARLVQRPLSFEVPPDAYDDATIRASKLAEGLVEDLRIAHNWETKREEHMRVTRTGGTGAIAVDWDAKNGTTFETVLGVPEFVVEPGARDAETARWWIKLQLLPPAEVQAMFPDHFETPPQADGRTGMQSTYDYREQNAPLVRVLTYYERPNPLCPEGRFAVETGGLTVEEGAWPFPWTDRLNLVVARETIVPGEAYGSTSVSDVRSPQTAYNAAWSGFLEHMREASNHRLVIDESWVDAIDTLNDRAGAPLIGKVEKGKPDYLRAPAIPSGLVEGIGLLRAEIDNLMGVHDVSRGQAPANIESGLGLSILSENDSSPLGRLIKEEARIWGRVATMCLQLHEKLVKSERNLSVRGERGMPTKRKWKGSDLLGQVSATVPEEAIVPKSRAAQQAWAEQAVQMGLISSDDPLAVMRFAKLADMPDKRGIVDAVLPDVSKAIRENEAVVMNEIPVPRDFDDHAIHIEIHNEFRKTEAYELMSDEQRNDMDLHIQAHQGLMQSQVAGRRMASDIDPALASAPRADGAPAVDPLPPVAPPAPPAPPAPGPEPISADQAASDMLAAIQQL